jgi:hypothetical protein
MEKIITTEEPTYRQMKTTKNDTEKKEGMKREGERCGRRQRRKILRGIGSWPGTATKIPNTRLPFHRLLRGKPCYCKVQIYHLAVMRQHIMPVTMLSCTCITWPCARNFSRHWKPFCLGFAYVHPSHAPRGVPFLDGVSY